MKRAMPRLPICRLPIGKSYEITIGQEPRLTAACNLQMVAARFLQIATSGSFVFLGNQ
jgi:hypothetical protein